MLILGFAALPLGIGTGILKYRLYEIYRLISRTLAYAIVTGLLVGVYAGLVLLATHVLTVHGTVAAACADSSASSAARPGEPTSKGALTWPDARVLAVPPVPGRRAR